MRKLKTFSEFVEVTGMLIDCDDVACLGLSSDLVIGCFWPASMNPVLDFCRDNTKFHVATHVGDGIFVNRFQESGKLFFIADGESDPDIWFDDSKCYHLFFF